MNRLAARLGASPEFLRVLVIWLVLSAILTPIVIFVLGPQLPPGSMTAEAHSQTQDNIVMTAVVTPIVLLVFVFFGYALVSFRHRGATVVEDGEPLRGNNRVAVLWLVAKGLTILFLATWGSYELFPGELGAGGGQGPDPIALATPADAATALQVQVIGQQWDWTFRYPSYGDVETTELVLPVHRQIVFHVTSLDVIHSFWAIQLAVKADAVPGTDNVAFLTAKSTGPFEVRCAELCGIWHGHMYTSGRIVSASAFATWIRQQRHTYAPATGELPPYRRVYYPPPLRRAG